MPVPLLPQLHCWLSPGHGTLTSLPLTLMSNLGTCVYEVLPFESSHGAFSSLFFLPAGTSTNSCTVGWHLTSELLFPPEGLASCWTTRTADWHFSMQILPSTFTHSTHTSSIMSTPALHWKHLVSWGYILELQHPHGLSCHNLRPAATTPMCNLPWAMPSFSINCTIILPIQQLFPPSKSKATLTQSSCQAWALRSLHPLGKDLSKKPLWSQDPSASQNSR